MEFHNSEEYRKLPDEFNRDYVEKPVQDESGKKGIWKWAVCVFTAMILVFPVTIRTSGSDIPTDPIDVPPWPNIIDEPGDVEYDIVGMWECGNNYYEFLENGLGYWTDGTLFIPVSWEKTGNDYTVTGEGMSFYSKNRFVQTQINFTTHWQDGKVMMSQEADDSLSMYDYFTASSRTFNTEKVLPLLNTTIRTNLAGDWEHESHMLKSEDGYYVCLSYITFRNDGTCEVMLASTETADWAQYDLNYQMGDVHTDSSLIIGEDTELELSVRLDSSHTYSYSTKELRGYRFIDENGEGMLVNGMNITILRKMDWGD